MCDLGHCISASLLMLEEPIRGLQFILNAILSLIGGDLFERVAAPEYKLTEEKVQIFMRQIIQGLEYIHELNIVHLDIKPYNILFSDKVGGDKFQLVQGLLFIFHFKYL